MKPKRKRGQTPIVLTITLIAVLLLTVAFLNRGKLSEHASYVLESSSEVQFTEGGGKITSTAFRFVKA